MPGGILWRADHLPHIIAVLSTEQAVVENVQTSIHIREDQVENSKVRILHIRLRLLMKGVLDLHSMDTRAFS